MQDFLNLRKPGGASGTSGAATGTSSAMKKEETKKEDVLMTINVLLADKRVVTASVREYWKTRDVYQVRKGEEGCVRGGIDGMERVCIEGM